MKGKENKGLYRESFERDACGIGFIAHLKNQRSHKIISDALLMLTHMEHRGACGCEENTGDGAGILIQKPHQFFLNISKEEGLNIPAFEEYGVGMMFFPKDETERNNCKKVFEGVLEKVGFDLIGYRTVPFHNTMIGPSALATEPVIQQAFVKRPEGMDEETFERKLYVVRNYTTKSVHDEVAGTEDSFYFTTLSYKTMVYKGQLTTEQLGQYFPDLQRDDVDSALAVVHSRFSTNTFPKWKLAQPFRYIAHNGEINTVRGNVNWMSSREKILESTNFTPEELDMIFPVCDHTQSDSANLDNAIELLVMGGRSLPHVMMMLIPEAWQENDQMEDHKKDFYRYYAQIMEPWDGPASISFTDGKFVGATLDRNGLRPSRYCVTDEDIIIMGSEAGVIHVDPATVKLRGRLQPGKIFVADLEQGRIISDDELKNDICTRQPYTDWLKQHENHIDDLPAASNGESAMSEEMLLNRQLAFGYSSEDLKVVISQLSEKGIEPLGSMGVDIPLPVLSEHSQHLSHYFKQLFAQVTNPPIDPIREKMVMSLISYIGSSKNIFDETPEHCSKIRVDTPVLTNKELNKLKHISHDQYKSVILDITFDAVEDEGVLEKEIDRLCAEAVEAAKSGTNILILSDKGVSDKRAPMPSLLACGAVHHALIREGLRARSGLVIEAGDIRETHHVATLLGYGAAAVNPYLAYETIVGLYNTNLVDTKKFSIDELKTNFIKGIGYGLRKIFSKMGISTLQSYQGAQIFEALGIGTEVVNKCFAGTVSRIEGLGFDEIAKEALMKHQVAFKKSSGQQRLDVGGVYQWKQRGEYHMYNPESIHLLQHSTRTDDYQMYKKYARVINERAEKASTLRGQLEIIGKEPIPINEVEPAEKIYKRFATGAMSFGSISHEAHSTLAIAMNRIGGKSNSGEGGEDEVRFEKKENGDWERSAIKQVASGRFGVTSYYLSNANELQIKMAQGAKPGEGGQLPGHKVDDWIGRVRHSTPGVGLISPPPHHDIYSIEDLAQLIFDLKNANREARINVKLVAEAGVGTVAAGVAKAHADVILVSGHDGGTGASPLSSIRHAGLPWELGVAEAHQTLVKNKLRGRVVLQTDGQIKTGRDIAVAALLGAEEWGVATAALVVEGCILMRKCHLNTCPVGIATQNKELRKRFTGKAEHVVNFFKFLVEDLREIMAELGFRTVDEMIGRVDKLQVKEDGGNWKANKLDLSPIIHPADREEGVNVYKCEDQDHGIDDVLDWKLVDAAKPALDNLKPVFKEFEIVNTDRSTGTILSNEISKKYKGEGLPTNPHHLVHFKFKGGAGQSFGAFGAKGLKLELEGEANDYFGKGLSGARLILYPHAETKYDPSTNMIVGNVAFYGATGGHAYIRGMAGERFCVRNSGVKAVVEGIGDHGCEYMTGGIVVILGKTGRNFAAGMSGGVAYIFDEDGTFKDKCNREMVDFDPLDLNDYRDLKRRIDKHYFYTNSDVAERILSDWDTHIEKFVKVMPRDYKAVLLKRQLEAIQAQEDKKEDSNEIIHG